MIALATMSFMAGNVAILSPCVLPALPFVVSSAFQDHKLGPALLAVGMLTSFVMVAATLAMFGTVLGVESETVKVSSSVLLILMGLFFLIEKIHEPLEKLLGKLSNKANNLINSSAKPGLFGQFIVGALVGVVWSPCIGPTLGSALGLAAQAQTRTEGLILIIIYAFGIILPFLLIAYGAKFFSFKIFKTLSPGKASKRLMGLLMIGFGLAALSGIDKLIEAKIFQTIPESALSWLTSF